MDIADSVAKAVTVVVVFFAAYFLLPHFLHPLDIAALDEPLALLQPIDGRPQTWALLAAISLTAVLTVASAFGLRFVAPAPGPSTFAPSEKSIHVGPTNAFLMRVSEKLRQVRQPSIAPVLLILAAIVVAISFFRDEFGARTGDLLYLSDSHVYLDFAGTGESLLKGRLVGDKAIDAYGIGAAAIYSWLRQLGFAPGYALAYDMTWGFNLAFLVLWGACLVKFREISGIEEWAGIIFFLGLAMLVPPLVTTKQVWTLYPTMSATRYVPFLLLFGFFAWAPARAGLPAQVLAAILAFIGLCFAPDVGVVAVIGFTAGILLDRKIDWDIWLRVVIWLALLAIVFLAGDWLVKELCGYDLAKTIRFASGLAGQNLTSSKIPWTFVGLAAFSSSVFTIIYVGPKFFSGAVPQIDRIAFLASGMILAWGAYFVRRPDKNYWIFDALLLVVLIFFASKVQAGKFWRLSAWPSILTLSLFFCVADEGVHRSLNFYKDMLVGQIREHSDPKVALEGVNGPAQWANASRDHMLRLALLKPAPGREILAVTGQPYLATLLAPGDVAIQESGFSLVTNERIEAFAEGVASRGTAIVAIDGPDSPNVFHEAGNSVGRLLSAALQKRGYTQAPENSAPGWIVLANEKIPIGVNGER